MFARFLILVISIAVETNAENAGLVISRLPPDGTWAEYDLAISSRYEGLDRKSQGRIRVSSVGQVQ